MCSRSLDLIRVSDILFVMADLVASPAAYLHFEECPGVTATALFPIV